MKRHIAAAGLLALLGAQPACQRSSELDDTMLSQRAQRMDRSRQSDSTTSPLARWLLPRALNEISGLALSADGRLFAHGDEVAVLYEIDYRHGVMVKHFQLGRRAVRDDFEALTIVGPRFYLLSSRGRIYQFAEGDAGARVEYGVHDTGLGKECEFEGMTWDSLAQSLVLACKNVRSRRLRDNIVLYRVGLDSTSRASPIVIPLERARGSHNWQEIKPSDLTVDPLTGRFVLVAAQQKGLVELTREGQAAAAAPLPDDLEFAEGLALTRDSLLIISTEATSGPAAISVYRRR